MTSTMPLISFILPYYNLDPQMLCACIESILRLSLTPQEREVIVVDDGSDQSPLNELMRYGDDIVYLRQKNGGVSVARNAGLQVAKGCYVQFVDADDLLIREPYEYCIGLIRQDGEADMVLFDFTSRRQAQATFHHTRHASGAEYMHNHNIRGSVCCYLFRRDMLGSMRFTPGVRYGEDEEFTPQLLLRAERIYVTDAMAYFYREHPHSAVHQTDDKSLHTRLDDTRDVILRLNDMADTLAAYDQTALRRRIAQLTMDYVYNTIWLTRSRQEVDARTNELRKAGLFPLPDRDYSTKYQWFRRLSASSLGMSLLMKTLPILKHER